MSEQLESLVPAARASVVLVTCVTMGLLLSACGQKGPLTLVSASKTPAIKVPAGAVVAPAVAPVATSASAPPPRTWGSPPP